MQVDAAAVKLDNHFVCEYHYKGHDPHKGL